MIKSACNTIIRNWLTSLPTILVIGLLVSLLHSLFLIQSGTIRAVASLQEKLTFTVYLKPDADTFEVSRLVAGLKEQPGLISDVAYTSSDDAWRLLDQSLDLKSTSLAQYGLVLPPSITITPVHADAIGAISNLLQTKAAGLLLDQTPSQSKQNKFADKLQTFIETVENATTATLIIFITIFSVATLMLLGSVLHLGLRNRSLEITIMKLMGAHQAAITTPLIIEGALLGFLGFIVHLILVLFLPFQTPNTTFLLNLLVVEFSITILVVSILSWCIGRIATRSYGPH